MGRTCNSSRRAPDAFPQYRREFSRKWPDGRSRRPQHSTLKHQWSTKMSSSHLAPQQAIPTIPTLKSAATAVLASIVLRRRFEAFNTVTLYKDSLQFVDGGAELAAMLHRYDRHLASIVGGKDQASSPRQQQRQQRERQLVRITAESRLQVMAGLRGDAASCIAILRTPALCHSDQKTKSACVQIIRILEALGDENYSIAGQNTCSREAPGLLAEYWDMVLVGQMRALIRECLMTRSTHDRNVKVRLLYPWLRRKVVHNRPAVSSINFQALEREPSRTGLACSSDAGTATQAGDTAAGADETLVSPRSIGAWRTSTRSETKAAAHKNLPWYECGLSSAATCRLGNMPMSPRPGGGYR